MKMKMITAAMLAFALGAGNAFAQKGVEDGSRFGHGEDSLKCLQNLSIYAEYVKTGNYKDAYLPWKAAYDECPKAQVSTYINGAKILHWFIDQEQDAAKREAYVNELMAMYDQRLQYLDDLNALVRTPASREKVLGTKVHDYVAYTSNLDVDKAYAMLTEVVDAEQENTDYYILQDFINISDKKYKADANHREQFINDYQKAAEYAKAVYERTQENPKASDALKEATKIAKDYVDGIFINSGAASCENLQAMYAPKIEENKDNLEYLKTVVGLMKLFKCTDQEAYFQASEYAHAVSPTAETAVGCAYMYYKKGDMEKALQFFDQAISLEDDAEKKSEDAYNAAVVCFSKKQLSRAKGYVQKSLAHNDKNGKAYILLANMYASSPNWSDESALNRCTYYLAIDKLQRAKSVDPSVTEEANKLIGTYAAHTPKAEDLFFLNLKKGDSITIGGWIGESTVIR
jgi:tetratricopeptide (TPR) repeat protein